MDDVIAVILANTQSFTAQNSNNNNNNTKEGDAANKDNENKALTTNNTPMQHSNHNTLLLPQLMNVTSTHNCDNVNE